jgi:hypothetical protein
LILIKHAGIHRAEVRLILARRWPEVVLQDIGDHLPSSSMTVEGATLLARRRRGIEPIRIVTPPQVVPATAWDDEPSRGWSNGWL